ncbi:helix-hairpin-helix domain-containing protein [Peribacillus huizhouensis]|uniref:Competence protein ComEA n=1 Tax=Peribacillus huizhouensis TaxID=1501239 RepID=A0ABR6CKC1_9BACI|nr:helix-hairpin-helix domain-containing protein [Peribacillus huizhouensis]MBA9025504.1 competence protein ComEA [Peribacillus huizhouensis]
MNVQGKKKIIIGIAVGLALLLGFAYFQISAPEPKVTDIFSDGSSAFDEPLEQQQEAEKVAIIKVDVKGAVNRPGVYIAEAGDRVIDLIADAGDFAKEADKDQVNLAQVVEDQMVILVPRVGDESVETIGSVSSSGSSSDGKINLNTATQAELETLTGVGPSKALSIIDYREKNGKFHSVEDLKKISGIGDKTFEKLKDSIKVK